MKDRLHKKLKIGQTVVFHMSGRNPGAGLQVAEVTSFTPLRVRCGQYLKAPNDLAIVEPK